MKFRDDIDIDNTWVVSDTHFGHENIVGFCHRPEDHDQVMIAEWRANVPDDATVLHLGDLTYKSNAHFRHIIVPELTGARKLLILGNHDRQGINFYRKCGFSVCKPFAIKLYGRPEGDVLLQEPKCEGQVPLIVSFSHYPKGKEDEAFDAEQPLGGLLHTRIHGHIHNNGYTRDAYVPFLKNHINMSVEQTKYRPVNLGLLLRAVLLGEFPETTEDQLADARARKEANSK